jgi:hypothetical protein
MATRARIEYSAMKDAALWRRLERNMNHLHPENPVFVSVGEKRVIIADCRSIIQELRLRGTQLALV